MNKERKVEQLEEAILEALLKDIDGCGNDAVDMFKALERYRLFNEGRKARAEADSWDAGRLEDEEEWKDGGYQ